jgi:hypothetical protein
MTASPFPQAARTLGHKQDRSEQINGVSLVRRFLHDREGALEDTVPQAEVLHAGSCA